MNIDRFRDTDLLSVTLTAKTVRALFKWAEFADQPTEREIAEIGSATVSALDPPPSQLGDPPPDVTQ